MNDHRAAGESLSYAIKIIHDKQTRGLAMRFSNKSVLVTGAASGIGAATAVRFAQEGAGVLLCDINEKGLAEVCDSIRAAGGRAETRILDVRDSQQCAAAVAEAKNLFGKLDVLGNIAGIALCRNVTDITDAEWQRLVEINLNGVFYMTRAALPLLVETKGCIVNMSSSAGLVGQAYNSAYCATKAAVTMFTKSLALEYAKRGVRVNAVCPGGVLTPLMQNFSIPEDADQSLMLRLFPLLDIAKPEEIASAVAYLASEEARYITGIALPIDGGQTAG
jgi:meso-butanediol dehydrogenase/(S,S)-butanediol dehydrogenase/diacetyl reductase